jgi:hypothetical protein
VALEANSTSTEVAAYVGNQSYGEAFERR